jgi:arylsulfatase A-like enzyme
VVTRGGQSLATARALFWGAIFVALAESLYVLVFSAPSFDGLVERAVFIGAELCLYAPLATLLAGLGLALGGALAGLEPRARANLLALLGAPLCGWVGWLAFRGPSAQRIPGHDLYAAAIGMAGVAAIYAAAILVPRWTAHCASGRARRWAVFALALVVFGLHATDQRILPRLYPFFHRGLELLAILVAAVGVSLFPGRRGRAQLVAFLLAGIGGAVSARVILRSQPVVGTVLADRAPGAGTLARLHPRPAPRPVPVVGDDDRAHGLPPGPRLGSRDVVLVTVDALRADRLDPRVCPNMAALAARGIRFADAYTQVPHTSFAVATLLTGKYVHGLSALGLDAASHQTLAQVFRRERYKTAAFYPPAVFFIDHERLAALEKSAYGFEYVKYEYLEAKKRTDQVVDFFEHERPAHAFVWVHYLEPHEPYDVHEGVTAGTPGGPPPEPGRPDAVTRYEGEIRYVDREVGRLLEYLRRARPGALVILAADHGEEFGEHGGRYHGTTLFDEQVHVPLVFAPVDGPPLGPRIVDGPVGLIDVAPSVLALLGIPSSAQMRGRDLSPWMGQGAPPPSSRLGPVFAEIDRKEMVVDGGDKLVCDLSTGGCALYDRANDPGERRDAQAKKPEALAHLRGLLDRFLLGESRFERRAAVPAGMETLFERARLGDAAVTVQLAATLASIDDEPRLEVLRMLLALPPAQATKDALARLPPLEDEARALRLVLLGRLGDDAARSQLAELLASPGDRPWLSTELYARAALAAGTPSLLERALFGTEDRELVVALADALARTRDPGALDALLVALAPVRSRAEVVAAIQQLGDPRAIAPMVRWLPNDPYVPVRVAMVRALIALAGPERALQSMSALLAVEREGPVIAEVCAVLPAGRAVHFTDPVLWLGRSPARDAPKMASELIAVTRGASEPVAFSETSNVGESIDVALKRMPIPAREKIDCVLAR